MPKFSTKSDKTLNTCHNDLQVIFRNVVKNYDCSILEGHRDKKTQEGYFKKKLTKLHYPKSKHNLKPSMAVDVTPYPVDWQDQARQMHFAGYVQATAMCLYRLGIITHIVRWGGDWDQDTELSDNRFQDFPHFELVKPKDL